MIELSVDVTRLPMWIVYDHPLDYPMSYVARLHYSLPEPEATREVLLFDDLDELRSFLAERGCVWLDRDPDDDPVILETWLV